MNVLICDLLSIYNNEIVKNVKNKKKLYKFEKNKMMYICIMKYQLDNNLYKCQKYNIFLVHKPALRLVMSSCIYDKVVNHYVTKYILMPKLEKYLDYRNVATRKNMGSLYGLKLLLKQIENNKKYNSIYFLKMDIKKYFYNIDHNVLKEMIKSDLTTEEYCLVSKIIDSTNESYINKIIEDYKKNGYDIPYYEYDKGLSIGSMTNQFFAIFYLSKLQHYIIHDLHLKDMVIYMDDYIIIHHDKKYLEQCKIKIEEKLINDYKLLLNKNKTYIRKGNIGITFLGYNIKVINQKTIIKLTKNSKNNIKKGIKRTKYLCSKDKIDFEKIFSTYNTYMHSYQLVNKDKVTNIVNKYW